MADYGMLPDGEIIDLIGRLDAQLKKLKDERSEMIDTLIDRGFAGGTGRYFSGSLVAPHMRWSIDRKRLEADQGEEFIRPYLNASSVNATVKVSARKDVAAQLVAAK